MSELIEGKCVIITNKESGKAEMGIVKRFLGKLVVAVKRNNSMINLTPGVLELYDIMYSDEME